VNVDALGRVQVRFHWDRPGGGGTSSAWIRVAVPAGRLDQQFFPEVGVEVLVGFLQSDPSMPVVLGALYNGQDQPPQ
jgi:type VI secretion system secreted protein VgrG